MNLHDLQLFPIDNGTKFEDFCSDLYKTIFNDPHTQKNGRNGQKQDGVDIFCREMPANRWIGIQCKVKKRNNKLTYSDIENEIEQAISFNPRLSTYIISTTYSRDAQLQEKIRLLNDESINKGSFIIKIDFWEDIQNYLSDMKFEFLLFKYYNSFIVDSLKYGFSVGRMITVIVGSESKQGSQYELLISKIPLINSAIPNGILYFQDRFIISNLNTRCFSIIEDKCSSYDLRYTIDSPYDREIIAKWLSNSDIKEIIYSSDDTHYYHISHEEHIKLVNKLSAKDN